MEKSLGSSDLLYTLLPQVRRGSTTFELSLPTNLVRRKAQLEQGLQELEEVIHWCMETLSAQH